jgi:hypothetical protein
VLPFWALSNFWANIQFRESVKKYSLGKEKQTKGFFMQIFVPSHEYGFFYLVIS